MQLAAADRALVFWGVCLPTRYLFASVVAPRYPTLTRVLASLVGARWVLNENFKIEGFFGGPACSSTRCARRCRTASARALLAAAELQLRAAGGGPGRDALGARLQPGGGADAAKAAALGLPQAHGRVRPELQGHGHERRARDGAVAGRLSSGRQLIRIAHQGQHRNGQQLRLGRGAVLLLAP
eukprot:scaffold6110_cov118-Isochrysis_galbana.AAC.1